MEKIHPRTRYALFSLLIAADTIFFLSTDPQKLPVAGIIVGFILLALTIFAIVFISLWFIARIIPNLVSHTTKMAVLATSFLIITAALSSIGQLSVYDFGALLVIGSIFYFYILRIKTAK